jgi:dTMP kinase
VTADQPSYSERGLFIAFEGGDGVGKSTQARALVDVLSRRGYDVVATSEPGGSVVGQQIRAIVLDPATGMIDDRAETLLYAADKAEHVRSVIRPALDRGAVVVTDRYVDSTLAYQGAGRALGTDAVEAVARWATGDLRPHLTVLLDVAPELALGRFSGADRLEAESTEFHTRVRTEFLRLAEADRAHYLVVDAHRALADIAAEVLVRVDRFLATVEVAAPHSEQAPR